MSLSRDSVRDIVGQLWRMHLDERYQLDIIREYRHGRAGLPTIPREAADDIKEIRSICGQNIIGPVVDSFASNLIVVGYRSAAASANAPAWARWQRNRLDRRQGEVHSAVLTYGTGYAVVTPGLSGEAEVRYRSPRRLLAVYDDPQVDEYPRYALETWIGNRDGERALLGLLLDDEGGYPLHLGSVQVGLGLVDISQVLTGRASVGEMIPHGAGVCPVVRFQGIPDEDGVAQGEVRPLTQPQREFNSVNFDRLVMSRFGAFPKHVISGYEAGDATAAQAISSRRMLTFDDPDVRATSLAAADGRMTSDVLAEIKEHVALTAKLPPAEVAGKIVNLSAEALAAAEKASQRKIGLLRTSLGESHESVMRLMARIEGDEAGAQDTESEAVWLDTEARPFGAIVDGITKLASVGVPAEEMLPMVPGLSQAQIESIRRKMRTAGDFAAVVAQVANGAASDSGSSDAADPAAQG